MAKARSAQGQMAEISAHAPRAGTIEVYARAVESGAEYVELDVRRTADGEPAAFHDARTRQGEALSTIGYARLCELAGRPRRLGRGELITNRPAAAVALRG